MADKPKKIIPDADYKRLMPKFRAHVISESAAKRLNLGSKPEKPAESKPAPKKAAATNAPIQISVGKRGAKKWRKGNGPWQYGEPPKPDKKQISTEEKKDMAELRKAQAGHEKALRTADPAHAARLRTIADEHRRVLSDPPKPKKSNVILANHMAQLDEMRGRHDRAHPEAAKIAAHVVGAKMHPEDIYEHVGNAYKGAIRQHYGDHGGEEQFRYDVDKHSMKVVADARAKGSSSGLMAKMKVTKKTPPEDGKGTIGSKPTIDPIAAAKLKEVRGSFVVGEKPNAAVSSLMNKLNATRPVPRQDLVDKAAAHVEARAKEFEGKVRITPYRTADGIFTHAALDRNSREVHLGRGHNGDLRVEQQAEKPNWPKPKDWLAPSPNDTQQEREDKALFSKYSRRR